MKSLFPEMEAEIREDRKASKREERQRARDYLRRQDTSWLVNRLLDKGPESECNLLMEVMQLDVGEQERDVLSSRLCGQLHSLWVIGKFWRKSLGIHPGAGVQSFRFGIRGVHPIEK